eukprot:758125-Karenia_brevis.AAC.1
MLGIIVICMLQREHAALGIALAELWPFYDYVSTMSVPGNVIGHHVNLAGGYARPDISQRAYNCVKCWISSSISNLLLRAPRRRRPFMIGCSALHLP